VRFLCHENHGLFSFGGMWCIFFGLKDGYFTHMVGGVFQMCLGTYKGNETTELLIGLPVLRLRHGWRDLYMIEQKESFKAVRGIVL